jgi:lipoprotein-releasing system ATP-binding protein
MTLVAKNISKTFYHPEKVTVLSNVSLEVKQGESVAVCGRSGSGKTTLLHILGTLEKADAGDIWIDGQLVTNQNSNYLRKHFIGFIFQSYNLLEDFSALENVLMPAKIARMTYDKKKGIHLLEQVGLSHRANFPVKLLSGGERQRLAIARSLCNNPRIILADEPSGNLDFANSQAISNLLLSLVREQGKSLILVTHDEQLASMCDRRYDLNSDIPVLQTT